MKNSILYSLATAGFICLSIGFFKGITHSPSRNLFLLTGTALVLVFHVLSVMIVVQNKELGMPKKLFWFTLTITVPLVGGILYLMSYQHLENKEGL